MVWKIRPFLLFAILALALSSCGIYSLSGSSISPDLKTFTVIQFPNNATLVAPQLSQIFCDKMRNKILSETRLSMLPSGGDVQFEGAITAYGVSPASLSAGDKTAANRLTITLKVIFTNSKNPKDSYEQSFTRYADFTNPSLQAVENDLIEQITKQLVEDIYNKTFINW